jgi:hypothetical protein
MQLLKPFLHGVNQYQIRPGKIPAPSNWLAVATMM